MSDLISRIQKLNDYVFQDDPTGQHFVEEIISHIATLEAQLRWIPLTERLPEVGVQVLVWPNSPIPVVFTAERVRS